MRTLDRLRAMLPQDATALMAAHEDALTEIRLRAGYPAQLRCLDGSAMASTPLRAAEITSIAASLLDYSVYAHEAELGQGYFTMPDGCRVGVCGRMTCIEGRAMDAAAIASMCVRLGREIRGSADGLYRHVAKSDGGVRSLLLLSPPGLGKTTLLRDLARQLSEAGRCVAIADERHELAACVQGVPTMDVGPCTDVLDGAPKARAMRYLLRAMAPQVIVTDEIGSVEDARAIAEVSRCGVAVVASAHADGLDAACRRAGLREAVRGGCFDLAAVLGNTPGELQSVYALKSGEGDHAICAGAVRGHRVYAVRKIAEPRGPQAG